MYEQNFFAENANRSGFIVNRRRDFRGDVPDAEQRMLAGA
jgi:hypothetical protein